MIILGDKGHAHEVMALAELLGWGVSEFIGEGNDRKIDPGFPLAMGVGDPRIKSRLADWYESSTFPVLIHNLAAVDGNIGSRGCVVAAGAVIGAKVNAGDFCLFNYNCSIGHDVKIGRCVTISPNAVITCGAVIGDEAFIGAGSVTLPGVKIGHGATVGAGAVVARDVEPGKLVMGNPGRVIPNA